MYYASADNLGSINLLVKEDETIASDVSYDAWGRQRIPIGIYYFFNSQNADSPHYYRLSQSYKSNLCLPNMNIEYLTDAVLVKYLQ